MPSLAVGVEYNGERFHGSQRQRNLRTVQGELEKALSSIGNEPISVTLAGRTDTGVHATNQVASFRTNASRPLTAWIQGTNANLPSDVAVHSIFEVDSSFDARRSALRRRYFYVIGMCDVFPAFGINAAHWTNHQMDVPLLNELASLFIGEKDFSSFCAAQDGSESRCRDVQRFQVHSLGPFVVLDITANAFLLRMVRNIAGCFLAASRDELTLEEVRRLLEAKDRSLAPATASAAGLYLVHVEYDTLGAKNKLRVPQILGPDHSRLLENEKGLRISYRRPVEAVCQEEST